MPRLPSFAGVSRAIFGPSLRAKRSNPLAAGKAGLLRRCAPRNDGYASRSTSSRWRHGFLHRGNQLAQCERLRQERELLVFRQALLEGVFGITRPEDDLEVGITAAHRF